MLQGQVGPRVFTPGDEVIGITRPSGSTDPKLVRQRTDFSTCNESSCVVTGFERGGNAWAGGTAFNGDVPPNRTGSLGGVWISNGKTLAQVDPWTCAVKCAPQAAPLASTSSEVTGLAYWEAEAALLMSDSTNLLYWVSPSACSMSAVVCDYWRDHIVPTGYTIGGLATDDVNRWLFVSASTFGKTPVSNKIWVGKLGTPSRPIKPGWCPTLLCPLFPHTCPGVTLGAITGLAYDACTQTLYLTDGRIVTAATITWDPTQGICNAKYIGCCNKQPGETLTGLCVVQKRVDSVGTSCVAAPCVACPGMVAGTYGSAFLGNRNFALTLRNAPTGSTPAFLAVGVGACSTTGFSLGFCGPVRVGLVQAPILLPVRVTRSGATACDGEVTISLAIPFHSTFCGTPVSTQWVMNCPGVPTGTGHAISNCVTFELTSN